MLISKVCFPLQQRPCSAHLVRLPQWETCSMVVVVPTVTAGCRSEVRVLNAAREYVHRIDVAIGG